MANFGPKDIKETMKQRAYAVWVVYVCATCDVCATLTFAQHMTFAQQKARLRNMGARLRNIVHVWATLANIYARLKNYNLKNTKIFMHVSKIQK